MCVYDMRRAFRRHAQWYNASNHEMAAKRPYWGTRYNKNNNKNCDKDDNSDALHSPNTIHFRSSQRLTLWNSGKMRTGKWDGEVLFCCGRSDEEVTHKSISLMICDVHFGDTRNDITPAITKWLPNNHTEEQYTTNYDYVKAWTPHNTTSPVIS